jgi:uncharacterized protein YndB with AHSA1/START domain
MTNNFKTLVIERIFDAPVEAVWKAWTDPELVKQWWGPKDWSAPVVKIDFRVGGTFLGAMRGAMEPGGEEIEHWSGGVYEEIVPMQKIVSTDYFTDPEGNKIDPKEVGMPGEWPDELRITVTFEDLGDGRTKLTLTHEGHPEEIAGDAETGWNQSLDKLAAVIQ